MQKVIDGLVPVFQGKVPGNPKEEINAVDARELHEKLGVQTAFKDWIARRIEECQFVENTDFILVAQKRATNGRGGDRRSKSYWLTLDAAKHIAMMERSEAGFAARQYFIECEKELGAHAPEYLAPAMKRALARVKKYRKLGKTEEWIATRVPGVPVGMISLQPWLTTSLLGLASGRSPTPPTSN